MGGGAFSLIGGQDLKEFRKVIISMTQALKWPNKARNDPYSLYNLPIDELRDWYDWHMEEMKKENPA